jgi:hypothetical protein
MSNLRAALEAEKAAFRKGPPCGIEIVYSKIGKEDAAALGAYLADLEVPSTAIARALKADGHNVGAQAVQRHRSGVCRCAA